MSKTDKTRPWWVRVEDHGFRGEFESIVYKGTCCYGCGCRSCTGYYFRRAERRRSRHNSRRALGQRQWD